MTAAAGQAARTGFRSLVYVEAGQGVPAAPDSLAGRRLELESLGSVSAGRTRRSRTQEYSRLPRYRGCPPGSPVLPEVPWDGTGLPGAVVGLHGAGPQCSCLSRWQRNFRLFWLV